MNKKLQKQKTAEIYGLFTLSTKTNTLLYYSNNDLCFLHNLNSVGPDKKYMQNRLGAQYFKGQFKNFPPCVYVYVYLFILTGSDIYFTKPF